ncbi:MAG TPA: bifunctional phosphopantothenoylcysteine decarboxylase/phosphopantothenate synthase, partial [Xanthobacteraceae bacterium]|nr:bifunctional phosphopantothenoylcysteine decarboxylase/phosphopantothenate synthase [Xanthobacteraceae bacterium]
MASITIRQLDEALKRRLRLRAARNGRSMEDEARTILRNATALDDKAQLEESQGRHSARMRQREASGRALAADASAPMAGKPHTGGARRILLIIGGGIAAYKALDLIRRLKEHSLAV